jgi:hypothetical protein
MDHVLWRNLTVAVNIVWAGEHLYRSIVSIDLVRIYQDYASINVL